MLASEHILIVPFATLLQPQLNEHNRALEYTISFLSLINNSTGLKPARTYRNRTLKLNTFYVRYGRVTRTISTAESPGR